MDKTEAYKEVQKWKKGFKAPSNYNKEIIAALTAANYVRLLRGQEPVDRLAVIPKWNWNNNSDPIKETIETGTDDKEIYRKWRKRRISIHIDQNGFLIMRVNQPSGNWEERIPNSKTAANFLSEWHRGYYPQFGKSRKIPSTINHQPSSANIIANKQENKSQPTKIVFPEVNF